MIEKTIIQVLLQEENYVPPIVITPLEKEIKDEAMKIYGGHKTT